MDENELGMNVGYETDYKSQKAFSITAKESEQLWKEYEINDIIVNLNKALSKVGNVTILEALEQLKKQTRFAAELDKKIKKQFYMREIKFRGKRLLSEDWEYGNLIQRPDGGHFIETGDMRLCPLQDFSVGQFTGLHDKNGKEIYEGDIVQLNEFVYEVGYDDKRFASFVLLRKQDMFKHYFGEALEANQVDVIGNIHDNPELLKGGK